MKSVLKLLLMLAVLNALFHSGRAAITYYQLKDSTEQMLTFGGAMPTEQLRARILEKAGEMDVPLQPEDLEVRRQGARTTASASYTQGVEVLPNYRYPVTLSYQVEAYSMVGQP